MTSPDAGGDMGVDPGPLRWVEVAAFGRYTCARTNRGHVRCWGELDEFELAAAPWDPEDRIASIAGGAPLCALTMSGGLSCQGLGADIAPTGADGVVAVDVSIFQGCFLDGTSRATCWSSQSSALTTPPRQPLTEVAVGFRVAAGLTADTGQIVQWGDSMFPDLDPMAVYDDVEVAGSRLLCGRRADSGRLDCVGPNSSGAPAEPVSRLFSMNANGACAELEANGEIRCWANSPADTQRMNEIPENVSFLQVAPGAVHVCGLTTDHEILCWGREDGEGRLTPPPLPAE